MPSGPVSRNSEILAKWRSTLNNGVIKSPCTPIDVPTETPVARILRSLKHHASVRPDHPAVVLSISPSPLQHPFQIEALDHSLASFLVSRGFQVGDRATAMLPNSIEWPVFHLAVWAAGGVVVGSSAAFKLYETVYQLEDSQSSLILTTEELLPIVAEAAKLCPFVKTVICVRTTAAQLPDGVVDFDDMLKFPRLAKVVPVSLDAECLILYSSGTTGKPKGVIHTHRTFHCCIEMPLRHWQREVYPVLSDETLDWYKEHQVITSACYHILGFVLLNWFLVTGSPAVLMKAFNGDLYIEIIHKFKPRWVIVTPPIFAFLAKDQAGIKAALSSLQMIMCGTAPLSQEVSDEFRVRHPNVKYIVQAYGMTEVGFSHVPLLIDEGSNASVGFSGAYYEQKLVNPETSLPCKHGERGEVCVRGPSQTIGYVNKPEETKNLMDEEGWIHTGDIGYIDERGYLYVVDRLKELIKVNFMNQTLQVPPAELEGILLANTKIRDAAIVGVPDVVKGELVRAYVVKENEELTAVEVESLVADVIVSSDKLAEFKRITGGVVFVKEIPRSGAGKILRRVLRDVN
ncbi:hypothetical protein PFISCL1PPCAC_14601 [Pristionchus fissidentatus]|uniref:AMP-binding protein n=1 Tax=Pristionchus fissidentatus TaxID=1538716 RepID=A0AAV5W031_9BILA|nr:hypothetical protein PFISCL1PPCAC_14601 [Pristionchus fissidentatus]